MRKKSFLSFWENKFSEKEPLTEGWRKRGKALRHGMACGTLNGENERVQGDQVADGGIEEVLRLFLLEGGPGSSGGFHYGRPQCIGRDADGRRKIPVFPASLLVPGRGLPGCQSSNRFNERSGGCSCRQRDSRHHD